MNKEYFKEFAIGLGVGLLIGVSIGILFAPQKGEKTRQLIAEKAKGVSNKVKDVVETVKSKMPIVKGTDKVHQE